jgi:glycosyltransferase involved in cell wall biosynthesis
MISLVIPVFNEESTIDELYIRTTSALAKLDIAYEIICVDDGSTDSTYFKLLTYHKQNAQFKVVSLSRNFGHQAAILAGLSMSRGDCVGIMDGDLQDPPELFSDFYAKMTEGHDVVYAVRKKRKESFFKRLAYWMYYRLLNSMSKTKLPLDSGDFSLMSRRVVNHLLSMPEHSLFIRGIRFWVGFKQVGIEYERDARIAGEPKYTVRHLIKLAYSGIFSFSDLPIKVLGRIGSLSILACSIYILYLIAKKIFFGDVPEGFTTLIIAIFFFGGVQLVGLRILGEYIHRIYEESRNRPLFIVKEKHL